MRRRFSSHPLKALQLVVEIQALPRASEDPGSPADMRGQGGSHTAPETGSLPTLSSVTESVWLASPHLVPLILPLFVYSDPSP